MKVKSGPVYRRALNNWSWAPERRLEGDGDGLGEVIRGRILDLASTWRKGIVEFVTTGVATPRTENGVAPV